MTVSLIDARERFEAKRDDAERRRQGQKWAAYNIERKRLTAIRDAEQAREFEKWLAERLRQQEALRRHTSES